MNSTHLPCCSTRTVTRCPQNCFSFTYLLHAELLPSLETAAPPPPIPQTQGQTGDKSHPLGPVRIQIQILAILKPCSHSGPCAFLPNQTQGTAAPERLSDKFPRVFWALTSVLSSGLRFPQRQLSQGLKDQ